MFAQLLRRKLTLLTQMYRALNSPVRDGSRTCGMAASVLAVPVLDACLRD